MDKTMRNTYRFKLSLTSLEKPSSHWIYTDVGGVPEFVLADANRSLVALLPQLGLFGCAPKTGMHLDWSSHPSDGFETYYQLTANPLSDTATIVAVTGQLSSFEMLRQS